MLVAYYASDSAGYLERNGTMECNCTSGEEQELHYDARGIPLCYACSVCWPKKSKTYRPDVLTDPNYWHDEPIDEEC